MQRALLPGHTGAAYNQAQALLQTGQVDEGKAALEQFKQCNALELEKELGELKKQLQTLEERVK